MPVAMAMKLWQPLRHFVYVSPLYRYSLFGQTPDQLRLIPRDPWPGDAGRGEALVAGTWLFGADAIETGTAWEMRDTNPTWREQLHGFGWLRDLRALGGDEARRRARDLVGDWIAQHNRWSEFAWRPDVLGSRLVAWLGNYDFFAASADDTFRHQLLSSIAAQARHLSRAARATAPGSARLAAIHGMIAAGAALPGGDKWLAFGIRLMERDIPGQIRADGGHCERSPSMHLTILRRLVDIRATLLSAGHGCPELLQAAIDRMAPMLRFFRHGDGGLALFNDSNEDEGWAIDMTLTQADARGRPPSSAPDSGFERLTTNRTLVLADVGAPPPAGLDRHAHAGTLSFEMSIGKERLIVNCGAYTGSKTTWHQAQRATAAHSTVSIEDTNSAELVNAGGLGRRPVEVTCTRREDGDNSWLDCSHDGYREPYGIIHRRRLYLAAGGDDLRGEDSLVGGDGHQFTIRFHLHPKVQASLIQDGAAVLLRLPSGAGWRLRASGGQIGLSESIYLGKREMINRSEQIVIEGRIGTGSAIVKWALQRVTS